MKKVLIAQGIKTPDGTELYSLHRHDFKTHRDADGNIYGIDGGLIYTRFIGNVENCKDISIYLYEEAAANVSSDSLIKARELHKWTSYGINGDEPAKTQCVKDMDTEHIKAILLNIHNLHIAMKTLFESELLYRKYKGQ